MKNQGQFIPEGHLYPVSDPLTPFELDKLDITHDDIGTIHREVRAVRAGGKERPPKKGEFYLSGAIPAAYRAPNDLDTPYLIARIVRVETYTSYKITHEITHEVK